ncbi:MAG: hypothetical protein AB7E36_02605 [Salinivirgaceae bacterium]
MISKIESLFEDYKKIGNDDLVSTIDFVDEHYSLLINFKSDEVNIIEQISIIFKEYFICLNELGRFSVIIEKRPEIKSFVENLNKNSRCFKDCFVEIEYLFANALSSNGSEYKKAISVLTNIQTIDPKNENISFNLKYAKLNSRRKYYVKFIIGGLIIAFIGLVARLVNNNRVFLIIDLIGFGIFTLAYLTQNIDEYLTEKRPTANPQ